ncbi:cell wall-active antibiotic response 4TMS protein YvqF [Herbihabitans rhizosphaerae]|uniref:Cell wall-active antibiotic response 4TMS protein YvqF n=1 Tax=Herbihabitans rhizosphaerae TaxID=1872711 RepID=A0A4Q7KKU0_9PSEU|nr:DUF1707 domain-containing protein [Herbihabitans rhizosphaerae]RZS36836.1 cell wall-active antibiotic response 4TMS protein YvqF [Herbihabitans rhizosphaerae]
MNEVPDPSQLRASNADRERVAKILNNAMAEGRLTVSELEERLDAVYSAKTIGELGPLTHDLPAGHSPAVRGETHLAVPQAGAIDRIGGEPTSKSSIAFMSSADRKGPWVVPPSYSVVAIMGGSAIDLTHARFAEHETTINVFTWWGGVEIYVPDDITVHVTGSGFMGAFDDRAHQQVGPPGAPVVKITGLAIMAGVEVKRSKKKQRRQRIGE